jgi:hypothetical protein
MPKKTDVEALRRRCLKLFSRLADRLPVRLHALSAIPAALAEHDLAPTDFVRLFLDKMDAAVRKQIEDLLAPLWGEKPQEALDELDHRLDRQRRDWVDLAALLEARTIDPAAWQWFLSWNFGALVPVEDLGDVHVLEQTRHAIWEIVGTTDDILNIATLYIGHAHFAWHEGVMHSPRLAILGPTRGVGKSTLLKVISRLTARALLTVSITEAASYRVPRERRTLLHDEFDNSKLRNRPRLQAILNSGHDRAGGGVTLMEEGEVVTFDPYCPFAYAGIGSVPFPTLVHRSIPLLMQRHDITGRVLKKFNLNDTAQLDLVHRAWCDLAANTTLNPNPEMPAELGNRQADNWRPLVAVADLFGPEWGNHARELAVRWSRASDADDRKLHVIWDAYDVMKQFGRPAIAVTTLIEGMVTRHDVYAEWRGLNDDKPAHRFRATEFADIIRDFDPRIRPRTVRPFGGRGAPVRGYRIEWFEGIIKAYPRPPDEEPTPASQSSDSNDLGVA